MTAIQWFPGHMAKTKREIKAALSQIDLCIDIVDARLPCSSHNALLARMRGERPCLYLMSKVDLADPQATQQWLNYFAQARQCSVYAVDLRQSGAVKQQLIRLCRQALPHRGSIAAPLRAMVTGVPNVGKSTLINALSGRKAAKVGNEPAVTRAQQRIRIDEGFWLYDTPGLLWPGQKDPTIGCRLAAVSAIKDTAYDYEEVAGYLVDYLLQHYPGRLTQYFKLSEPEPDDAHLLLQRIARKRGCVRQGAVDWHRVSEQVVQAFRCGALGAISLEWPKSDGLLPSHSLQTPVSSEPAV